MYKPELNLINVVCILLYDYQVEAQGLLDEQRNLSLVESHLVDYISVHIRFDLERYLLNMLNKTHQYISDPKKLKNFKPK